MSAVGRFGGETAGAGHGDHTMSPLRPLLVTLLLGSAAGLTGTMTAAPALTGSSTSVSLHGTYQIVTADLVGSHGEYIGERYRPVLQVGAATYPLRLPPRVRLRGGAGIGSISAGTVTASSVRPAPASTAPAVATSGVSTSVLVILAEWQGPDRMTTATARRVMFTDGAQWYSEVSNGAVTQHGDVTPWVHITGPPGGQCFTGGPTILSQAEAAAHALGFDPATYDRTVVYFPNQNSGASGCQGISGWAEEPGHHVWLNGYLDLPSITHEQGHNYGLSHAHAYTCSAGVLIGTCTFAEYGERAGPDEDAGATGVGVRMGQPIVVALLVGDAGQVEIAVEPHMVARFLRKAGNPLATGGPAVLVGEVEHRAVVGGRIEAEGVCGSLGLAEDGRPAGEALAVGRAGDVHPGRDVAVLGDGPVRHFGVPLCAVGEHDAASGGRRHAVRTLPLGEDHQHRRADPTGRHRQ